METSPTPESRRRRTRRADRYRQESGVAPSGELMQRTAPADEAPEPPILRHRSAPLPEPPPVMARPKAPPRLAERQPMPRWITAGIIGALVLLLALVTASSLMQAYLVRQEQARQDAHQRVVDKHPLYCRDLIERYAEENNLHPAFMAAVIMNESSFRTDAESSVGARGLMQLMPDTAQWIAGKLDIPHFSFDMMYDAETNIRFGAWYLSYLSRQFRGDPVTVASAYHTGQGQVARWLSDPALAPDGVRLDWASMPDGPTKTYAGRVTQDYAIYEALYYPPHAPSGEGSGSGDAVPDPDSDPA